MILLTLRRVYRGQKINNQSLCYFKPISSFWSYIKLTNNNQNIYMKMSPCTEWVDIFFYFSIYYISGPHQRSLSPSPCNLLPTLLSCPPARTCLTGFPFPPHPSSPAISSSVGVRQSLALPSWFFFRFSVTSFDGKVFGVYLFYFVFALYVLFVC